MTSSRLLRLGLLLAYGALVMWNGADALRRWDDYVAQTGPIAFAMRCGLLGLATAGGLWLAKSGQPASPGVRELRRLAYAGLLALAGTSVAWQWLSEPETRFGLRSVHFTLLALGQLGFVAWVAAQPKSGPDSGRGWARSADLLAGNLLLCLLLSEAGLAVLTTLRPSPLFFGHSVDQVLASNRQPPGADFFGAPLNSGGYLDDEFIVATEADLVVAVLADSFGIGIVPRSYNFVSVAETRLQASLGDKYERIAVHNFGVPGIGLPEYAQILIQEALPTNPELVVLTVFVGNDVTEGRAFGQEVSGRYALQQWQLYGSLRRALKLLAQPAQARKRVVGIGQAGPSPARIPPDILDPDLEAAHFSKQEFLRIESSRLEVANLGSRKTDRRFVAFFQGLDFFRRTMGSSLLVLLIPDEFQVNDELYPRVLARRPEVQIDRDSPQRRILGFCRKRGMACLDLLPELRAAEAEARTYHLRDTHLNPRGNQVVGEALARAIEAHPRG